VENRPRGNLAGEALEAVAEQEPEGPIDPSIIFLGGRGSLCVRGLSPGGERGEKKRQGLFPCPHKLLRPLPA
jgi:hypothetical protein